MYASLTDEYTLVIDCGEINEPAVTDRNLTYARWSRIWCVRSVVSEFCVVVTTVTTTWTSSI
jgi:hypothetical protein